jgi:quercetin dioxygenase-like cupin family protein
MRVSPVLIVSAAVVAASTCIARGALAQPPLLVELIAGPAEFTDDVAIQVRNKFYDRGNEVLNLRDASKIAVAKVTIQPKAVFPWHTHPGPVLINVIEGDFVYVLAADCIERWYSDGQAVVDAGFDNVHTAFNPSATEETVVIATFLGAIGGQPLTDTNVDAPDPSFCPLPNP